MMGIVYGGSECMPERRRNTLACGTADTYTSVYEAATASSSKPRSILCTIPQSRKLQGSNLRTSLPEASADFATFVS